MRIFQDLTLITTIKVSSMKKHYNAVHGKWQLGYRQYYVILFPPRVWSGLSQMYLGYQVRQTVIFSININVIKNKSFHYLHLLPNRIPFPCLSPTFFHCNKNELCSHCNKFNKNKMLNHFIACLDRMFDCTIF